MRTRLHRSLRLMVASGAALWAFVSVATAFGQGDEMTFGVEEVEEVGEASPVGQFLDEGLKYYEKKEYYQASVLFHKVLDEPDASADRFRPKAQYEMAKTLYRLKIYQGSMNLVDQIIETGEEHPYYQASLSWLILLSRKLSGDPAMLARVGKFAPYYPDQVPEKFRDEFAFLLGKYYYQEAQLDDAQKYLQRVSPRSKHFAEAKFLEGVLWVRQYEAKPAVNAFKAILGHLADQNIDEDPKLKRLEQLTLLSMARTFYSVGQYDKAVKYYSFIDQSSPYWLDSLFEESWSYFQVDQFNKALGNLHTLNSPFFDDEYFPESLILQAVVLFTNCRYDRVRLTIEEFELIYPDLKKQLQEYLVQYEDPTELYEFLVKINEGGGDFDPRLSQILSAALTDKTLKRTIDYVKELENEIQLVENSEPSWRDSPVGKSLLQELELSRSFALADAGTLAQERLQRVVRELNDLVKQGKKILVETAKAETDALDQQLRDQQFQAENAKEGAGFNVDDEHVFWTFRGEYWRDELGYYLYNVRSQCGR